jgi:hypothetical protein
VRTAPRVHASSPDAEAGEDKADDQKPGDDDAEENQGVLHGLKLAYTARRAKTSRRLFCAAAFLQAYFRRANIAR